MRGRGLGLILISALLTFAAGASAQTQPQYQAPSQFLRINGSSTSTWRPEPQTSIVQVEGPVSIELDRAKMSAQRAVVWLTETRNGQSGEQLSLIHI